MRKTEIVLVILILLLPVFFSIGCTTAKEIELDKHTQRVEQIDIEKNVDGLKSPIPETIEKSPAIVNETPLTEEPIITEVAINAPIPEGNDRSAHSIDSEIMAVSELNRDMEATILNSQDTYLDEPGVPIESPVSTPIVVESVGETGSKSEPVNLNTNSTENTIDFGQALPPPEGQKVRMVMPIEILYLLVLVVIILLVFFLRKTRLLKHHLQYEQNKSGSLKHQLETEQNKSGSLEQRLQTEQNRILKLGITDLESAQVKQRQLKDEIARIETELVHLQDERVSLKTEKGELDDTCSKLEKRLESQKLKLARFKELYSAVEHAVNRFHTTEIPSVFYKPLTEQDKVDLDSMAPSVMLTLNYMNYQELRKEFRENHKQLEALFAEYEQRYTTKANKAIYKLMVISLSSELQNILYNLKYEKLDNALLQVQALISKYLVIATDGNQSIVGTMRRFIGELEHLFENAVRIEYEYYIKREQARQEQLALRQQMREEAEERKRLEEQRKQIAFEESKYKAEIEKVREQLDSEPEDSSKRVEIIAKLEELNIHLVQVEEKKDEIIKLQNGKAGNVYIISNLGSFGDHVFKVGMTRRLDPQERVDELGSASVPFKFDVHSFIFSEDAVGLENELHKRLHSRRMNKVNLRKEFFDITLDELEALVNEINPTAEFNRTMLAEDYKISISLGNQDLPLSDTDSDFQNQDDEEELEAIV